MSSVSVDSMLQLAARSMFLIILLLLGEDIKMKMELPSFSAA